jgi:hypothetical protein
LQIMRWHAESLASHYLDYWSISLPNLFPHREVNKVQFCFTLLVANSHVDLLEFPTSVQFNFSMRQH